MSPLSDASPKLIVADALEGTRTQSLSDDGSVTSNAARAVPRFTCQTSTLVLDQAWQLSRSQRDTCFLVSRSDLPHELTQRFAEKRCLVVPAKTPWDIAAASASADTSIRCTELALQSPDTTPLPNELKAVLAFDSKGLLLDFDGLRGCLYHAFQSELPIVYAGHGSCVLVAYPYYPRELDALLAHANACIGADWHDAGMSFEDAIRRRLRSNLPHNVIVVTRCIDLTCVATSS